LNHLTQEFIGLNLHMQTQKKKKKKLRVAGASPQKFRKEAKPHAQLQKVRRCKLRTELKFSVVSGTLYIVCKRGFIYFEIVSSKEIFLEIFLKYGAERRRISNARNYLSFLKSPAPVGCARLRLRSPPCRKSYSPLYQGITSSLLPRATPATTCGGILSGATGELRS
jgi:hypothetical protein